MSLEAFGDGSDGSDDHEGYVTEERAAILHRETETALQIVLATGKFKKGLYRGPKYGTDWYPVEN
jgi:hypothetical protein